MKENDKAASKAIQTIIESEVPSIEKLEALNAIKETLNAAYERIFHS